MNKTRRRFIPSVTDLEQRKLLSLTLTQLAPYQGQTPWFEVSDNTTDAIGHLTIDWGNGSGIDPRCSQTWINYWGATYDYRGLDTGFYPNPGVYTITVHAWNDLGGDQTLTVQNDNRPVTPAELFFDGQGSLNGPVQDVIGDKFMVTPIAASNKTISTIDWLIRNTSNDVPNVIASQQVTQLNGFENTPWGVDGKEYGVAPTSITAYWGQYDGTEVVAATFYYTDGSTDFVSQTVQLASPTSSLTPTHFGTVNLDTSSSTYTLSAGLGATNGDPGLAWSMDVATTNGISFNIGTVQVIDSATATETYNTLLGTKWRRDYYRNEVTDAIVTPLLDNLPGGSSSVFYAALVGTSGTTARTTDTPGISFVSAGRILPGVLTVSIANQFTDYLMVQPTTGQIGLGIYVPVCQETWAWAATWDQKHPTRVATATNPYLVSANTPTKTYPVWDDLGTYYAGTPNPRYYEVQIS